MDLVLERTISDLPERCNQRLPEGLEILESVEVAEGTPKLSTDVTAARYEVIVDPANFSIEHNPVWADFARRAELDSLPVSDDRVIAALRSDIETRFAAATDDEPELVDIKLFSKEVNLWIEYLSTMTQGKSLFPEQIMEPILGPALDQEIPWRVVRKELLVARDGVYQPPTSHGVVQATGHGVVQASP
jgi:hypothetical protein